MKFAIPSGGKQQLAVILLFLFSIPSAVAQRGAQHARLSLISDRTALAPGTKVWVGLRFELDPGWHIYWTNPGDSGEPPKVTWHLPNGIQASDLQFPAPQRIKDHSLIDYGYQGTVVLLSKLTVASASTSNKGEISTDVRYLVCREVCVPAKEHLSLDLPVDKNTSSSTDAHLIHSTREHLPQPLPAGRVRVSAVLNPDTFVVRLMSSDPQMRSVKDFIPSDGQIIDNASAPKIESGAGSQVITLKKSEQLDHPVKELRGLLITNGQAYSTTIPVVNSGKATSQKTNSQKDHVSKKS